MQRKPVRLSDVARRAGTSPKTASRVLNGDARVADDTRARVQQAMTDLGYQVDVLARSLRKGVDETIAIVVPTIGDPFFASMIEEIERAVFEHGTKLLVATNFREPDQELQVIHGLLARRVSGVIVTPFLADYSFVETIGTPLVFLDRQPEGLRAGAIRVDDRGWAKRAVEHLIGHGHRRVAIVADELAIKTSKFRHEGYRDALADSGINVDLSLEALNCVRADDAYRATLALLALDEPPTAIFSARSETSVGVVKALHEADRRDVALVSFGDVELADLVQPAVTVIDHSPRLLARRSVERLRARISGMPQSTEDDLLQMRLIERGSGELQPSNRSVTAGGAVR